MNTDHVNPNPLTDPLLPVIQAQTLITAVEWGLFHCLVDESRNAESLAEELHLDMQGLEKALSLLCAMGYLKRDEGRDGGRYSLTHVSRQTLLPDSPNHLAGWVEFCRLQHKVIDGMEKVVRTGQPFAMETLLSTPENRRIHQKAMADTARPAAHWVAQQVPVKEGARRILDIGGSHGLYSAAICRNHPPLQGEVLELGQTIEEARKIAEKEGTTEVLRHIEGDILTVELEQSYDVVFMGNIVHHLSPKQNRAVFEKIAGNLSAGGTIAIWDIEEGGTEDDIAGASFSLFFYLTSGTACYTRQEITGWLKSAGFTEIQAHNPPGGATHMLITARIS